MDVTPFCLNFQNSKNPSSFAIFIHGFRGIFKERNLDKRSIEQNLAIVFNIYILQGI